MGNFTQIRKDAFEQIQADTGVLLKNFDPETATYKNDDIITTTSGGITVNCTPTYSDLGEDIDNVPNNWLGNAIRRIRTVRTRTVLPPITLLKIFPIH